MGKYGKINLDSIEAVINKLGGEKGIELFLTNSTMVVHRSILRSWKDGQLPEELVKVKLADIGVQSELFTGEVAKLAEGCGLELAISEDLNVFQYQPFGVKMLVYNGEKSYRYFEKHEHGSSTQSADLLRFGPDDEFYFFKK
ncbi:MAG: hypothetical protein WC763_02965 [Candidatus Paceibacterota bacterium]|jgi:hypothetical protein